MVLDGLPKEITNIWIAAHFKKKLKKKDYQKTSIEKACIAIQNPTNSISLRKAGQCLLGVSTIHLKQVEYLHQDCNDAFSKLKLRFKKNKVDLILNENNINNITIPEKNNNQLIIELNENINNDNIELDNLLEIDLNIAGSLLGSVSGDIEDKNIEKNPKNLQLSDDELEYTTNRTNHRRSILPEGILDGLSLEDSYNMDIDIIDENDNKNDILFDENSIIDEPERDIHTDYAPETPQHEIIKNNNNLDDAISQKSSAVKQIQNGVDNISINDDLKDEDIDFNDNISLGNISIDAASIDTNDIINKIDDNDNNKENNNNENIKKSPKIKKKGRKSKKLRFEHDNGIEFKSEEEQYINFDNKQDMRKYILTNRDTLHVWREYPLISLSYNELISKPLSKPYFNKLPPKLAKFYKDNLNNVNAKNINNIENNRLNDDIEQNRRDSSTFPSVNLDDSKIDRTDIHMNNNDDDNDNDFFDMEKESKIQIQNETNNESKINEKNTELKNDDLGKHINIDNSLSFDEKQSTTNENEPRQWGKRTQKTFGYLQEKFKDKNQLSFNNITKNSIKKHTVVGLFYELLVLKNTDLIELKQKNAYHDILIEKTDNFDQYSSNFEEYLRLSQVE